jgi:hypothetical protein
MKNVSHKEILLFSEAWLSLGFARLILIFLPFKKVVGFLGKKGKSRKESTTTDTLNLKTQETIKLAISRACHRSFWRTMCFEQALAAKFMLKRRKIKSTIHFGVAKSAVNNQMTAHAWLESDGFILTGAKGHNNFSVINSFTD